MDKIKIHVFQIKSLGSWFLYQINQGRIAEGEARCPTACD